MVDLVLDAVKFSDKLIVLEICLLWFPAHRKVVRGPRETEITPNLLVRSDSCCQRSRWFRLTGVPVLLLFSRSLEGRGKLEWLFIVRFSGTTPLAGDGTFFGVSETATLCLGRGIGPGNRAGESPSDRFAVECDVDDFLSPCPVAARDSCQS
jgi:hypothetical protein